MKNIINENIGFPYGGGAVHALKKKGVKAQKIAGAEFWLNIIEEFYKEKSFYLIGAEPEVIEGTIEKLRWKFQGIRIVGYHDGLDRKSTRLNSSHVAIWYAVFCLKKKII